MTSSTPGLWEHYLCVMGNSCIILFRCYLLQEALEVLRMTPSTVELVVCRLPGDSNVTPPGAPPPPPARREPSSLRLLNPLPPLQIEPCGVSNIPPKLHSMNTLYVCRTIVSGMNKNKWLKNISDDLIKSTWKHLIILYRQR